MKRWHVFAGITAVYLGLLAWALAAGQGWQSVAVTYAVLIIIYLVREPLALGTSTYAIASIPLILQSIGDIHFYSYNSGLFGYDWVMHIASTAAAAFVLLNFYIQKVRVREKGDTARKAIYILLAASLVITLGVMVEIMEWSSYVAFGETENFLGGPGNPDYIHGFDDGAYGDTGIDLINDTVGALLGSMLYIWYNPTLSRRKVKKKQDTSDDQ